MRDWEVVALQPEHRVLSTLSHVFSFGNRERKEGTSCRGGRDGVDKTATAPR